MKRILPIVTLASIACIACDRRGTPSDAAMSFYQKFKKAELLGVPDAKTLDKLRPYLSKGLAHQIELAGKAEEQYLAGQKEPEPGPSEGWNMFYTNYEGATRVIKKSAKADSSRATVVIECTYQEADPSTPTSWLLQVNLIFENGKWVIDDRTPVEGGKANESKSLRTELMKFCEENRATTQAK